VASEPEMITLVLNSPVFAAFVAGACGVTAVWLGLRRFKTERWWERKAAAYAAVIESLHMIEDVETERLTAIEKSVELPLERVDKIRLQSVQARADVRKYANLGGFVISEHAAKILNDLTQFLAQTPKDNLYEYHDARAVSVAKAIAAVKLDAKADLHT